MKLNLNRQNILDAIYHLDKNPKLKVGRHSYKYDLVYNENRYPPILVLSTANQLIGKLEIKLSDFNNNIETPFNILKENGFVVIEKNKSDTYNYKDDFINWITEKLADKSGAISSYISCLDWLSERYFLHNKITSNSIFEIGDINLISELYIETIKLQKDSNSYLYNPEAPSYGVKNYYSASLSNYRKFLKETLMQSKLDKFKMNQFANALLLSGLSISSLSLSRFIASLVTKPFIILTGLSGSGKTKLAQAFVQWISESDKQYKIIPVGADWTNREPLLGYPNGLEPNFYVTPDSGALQLILEASKTENQSKPYFMILDEMNLSHVERYFADFLSIMESHEKLKLYSGENRYSKHKIDEEFDEEFFIPQEIEWPKNLFIIGTVNIDETTYMFSPKVLDRANVIEFRITPKEMRDFFKKRKELKMDALFIDNDRNKGGVGQSMGKDFFKLADEKKIIKIPEIEGDDNVLSKFFAELQIVGSEFGYRSATEIELLITKLGIIGYVDEQGKPMDNKLKIDIAIMQKLLPKLHGSRKKLVGPLEILGGFCLNRKGDSMAEEQSRNKTLYQQFISEKRDLENWEIIYPISFEKIERMLKNVIDNGFTSYAEA